jgi:branched-subunit amino acid transport protein
MGTVDLSWGNPYLLAGIASALIAWKSRNLLLTIVAGMSLFVLLNTFL